MRNVNIRIWEDIDAKGRKFYINYEECKLHARVTMDYIFLRFYINYEECKLFISWFWWSSCYVFYINYEECK